VINCGGRKKERDHAGMYRAMSERSIPRRTNPAIRCIIITGGSGVLPLQRLEDF